MNNLTPEQLAFRAGYEQGRFDAQVEAAQQRHISYVCPQCHWSLDKQPAQQQWVGLTDEEIEEIAEHHGIGVLYENSRIVLHGISRIGFYRAIEAKLKEKNT